MMNEVEKKELLQALYKIHFDLSDMYRQLRVCFELDEIPSIEYLDVEENL